MGKRGPRATPAAVLAARASWRATHRAAAEAIYTGDPVMPDCLTGEAKALWDRIVPQLIAAEIPRQPDSEALAAMCMTWAQVCDATKTISRTGMLVKDAKGHPAANPLLKIREAALAQFLRYAVEFGFTPASRSRVQGQVQDQRKDNDPDLGKPRLKDFMVFPKVKS